MLRNLFLSLSVLVIIIAASVTTFAQQRDPIERNWYNDDKTAKIHIFKGKDGKFNGKVVWLKVPDRNGKPKVDERNPDPAKRNNPILGMVILQGFTKDGENDYEDGTIYDPKSGKTYSCKITRKGNELDVRGYVGVSLFGKTTTFYSE